MFEQITPESIKASILAALPETVSSIEGSYSAVMAAPVALEVWKIYSAMEVLLAIVYPNETSGPLIDKKCAQYGIVRNTGNKATAVLTVTGQKGARLQKNTVFLADTVRFILETSVSLPSESLQITVVAAEAGEAYNVGAGAINRIANSVAGITAVRNAAAAQGGSDPERDQALVTRLYARLQQPPTSGNAHQYRQWALEVSGVGAAKVFPLFAGPGTVKIVLASAEYAPVEAHTVQECKAYIEEKRIIGAAVTVTAATERVVQVLCSVTIASGTTTQQVQEAFSAALTHYLKELAAEYFNQIQDDSYMVTYIKVGYLLAGIKGVTDYSNLTVNGGTDNLILKTGELAQLGEVLFL